MLDKTYFENTYIQNENDLVYDNPDAIACITIDGYSSKDDDDDEGEVIAELYLTKHGDIIISWHDNAYGSNDAMKEIIAESKKMLKKIANEKNIIKTKDILAKTEQHSAKIETIKLLISKSKIILDDLSKDVKSMKDEMYKTERTDD